LTGVSGGVVDGKAAVSGNARGCSKGFGVVAEFEGVISGVGNGEAVVSGKVGDSSGAR